MKKCPACNRTYTDDDLIFCLEDGTQLQTIERSDAPTAFDSGYDPNKTLAFSTVRDTSPPPANVYTPPPVSQAPTQQSWSPTPQYTSTPQAKVAQKSGGKGWIIIAVAAVLVLGIGIVVLLTIIGKQSSNTNSSSNMSASVNRASTTNSPNSSGTNSNSSTSPAASFKDDFSSQNWPKGESEFGSFYQNGEYHMKGKPNIYVFMFPYDKANYTSRDADVKVSARSVDGSSPNNGYGLIMHGKANENKNLEGYGFLINNNLPAKYKIAKFADGQLTNMVDWTESPIIHTGTTPNQIEVRAQGSQLSLYINGQLVKSITDASNIKDGYVGLYTSEANDVAFKDLEISR